MTKAEGIQMSPQIIFQLQLVLGYVAWLLCFGAYLWPRLKAMDPVQAQRAIATLHSFRFFGLVFIVPASSDPIAGQFWHVCCLLGLRNRDSGLASAACGKSKTTVLAIRRRFQCCRDARLDPRLLPRYQSWTPGIGRAARRDLRDSRDLRAIADDHAYHRFLFAGA
jgi:hypothetical protein